MCPNGHETSKQESEQYCCEKRCSRKAKGLECAVCGYYLCGECVKGKEEDGKQGGERRAAAATAAGV